MIVEFQVNSSAFLAAQLNNLQSQKFCSPPPFAVGDFLIVVDHIEFTLGSLRHGPPFTRPIFFEQAVYGTQWQDVTSPRVQVAQPLVVVLVDLADVLRRSNEPPTSTLPISCTIVMDIDYYVSVNNDCYFSLTFNSLELGQLPPLPPGVDPNVVKQYAQNLAQSLVPSSVVPFNLAQIAILGGRAENAGASVDKDLSRLAFRAEVTGVGSIYSPGIWQNFLNGNLDDRLQGLDWSLFLDQYLWGDIVLAPIRGGVDNPGSGFQLVSPPGASYSAPAPDQVHIKVDFGGNIDAKICTTYITITIDANISVSAPNTFLVDMNLSWSLASGVCTVTVGLIGAAVGSLVDLVMPGVPLFTDPVSGFFLGVAAALYVKNSATVPPLPLPNCIKLSDTHYACTQQMSLQPASQFGTLAFTSLVATADGATLGGNLQPSLLGTPAIDPHVGSFSWQRLSVSCGEISGTEIADFERDPKKFVRLSATITLNNVGGGPLYLCDATIIGDTLGVFPQSSLTVTSQQDPVILTVTVGYPGDVYYSNAYPCQILVKTNGGIRLVSIPPPPPLTEQDIAGMVASLASSIGTCQKIADSWWVMFARFNPVWLIDPPSGSEVDHYWEFDVVGLAESESVSLIDAQQQVITTASGAGASAVRLSTVTAPALAGTEIGLAHVGAGLGLAGKTGRSMESTVGRSTRRGIGMTQQLLLHRATLALQHAAHSVGACTFARRRAIFGVMCDKIMVWDATGSSQPRLLSSPTLDELRGAIAWRNGILAFGAGGFRIVSEGGVAAVTRACCEKSPVYAAIVGQDVIYAIADGCLDVYSLSFRRICVVEAPGAESLAKVGATLFVGGKSGVAFYDISDPCHPRREMRTLLVRADQLVVPPGDGGRTLVAISNVGPSWLLDISGEGEPAVLAQFSRPPWFYRTARLPGLLVRLLQDGGAITISELGASKRA